MLLLDPSNSAISYPLLPPANNSSCLFMMPASGCQLLYCTTVLFKVLYCKTEHIFFIFVCFLYCLCKKYYKPITVQYFTADCVSWISRAILLDLQINRTYKHTHEWNSSVCRGLIEDSPCRNQDF